MWRCCQNHAPYCEVCYLIPLHRDCKARLEAKSDRADSGGPPLSFLAQLLKMFAAD